MPASGGGGRGGQGWEEGGGAGAVKVGGCGNNGALWKETATSWGCTKTDLPALQKMQDCWKQTWPKTTDGNRGHLAPNSHALLCLVTTVVTPTANSFKGSGNTQMSMHAVMQKWLPMEPFVVCIEGGEYLVSGAERSVPNYNVAVLGSCSIQGATHSSSTQQDHSPKGTAPVQSACMCPGGPHDSNAEPYGDMVKFHNPPPWLCPRNEAA